MDEITDIIGDFISGLNFTQEVISYAPLGQNTVIEISNTLHLRQGLVVSIDAADYTVQSIDDNSFEVLGLIDPVSVTLPTPVYFHGTPRAINEQMASILNQNNKTPFIYLFEVLRDRVIDVVDDINDREATLLMLFMDDSSGTWFTDDHYENTIKRMRKLLDYFIENIKSSNLFSDLEYHDVFNHADFGKLLKEKGHTEHVFDETLSGCELRFDLLIKKQLGCN